MRAVERFTSDSLMEEVPCDSETGMINSCRFTPCRRHARCLTVNQIKALHIDGMTDTDKTKPNVFIDVFNRYLCLHFRIVEKVMTN